jgi:hypothetical protein
MLGAVVVPSVFTFADMDITRACAWKAVDPGELGVGTDPDGYWGAVFDGRYVYFVPWNNGSGYHGEVLRYDTTGLFEAASSWATFNPGAAGVGDDTVGFTFAVFDGRHIYFTPYKNSSGSYGQILRYDTTGTFDDTASWSAFDAGDQGVGTDPDGYAGGAFDGRYVYFSPYDNGTVHHGEVLRLDTTGGFENAASWTTFDAGAYGVGVEYGYVGAAFDGRYVYFVPNCTTDTSHHGEVRRYDTTGGFTDVASWSAYDPGAHGVGNDPDGYVGAVFDGRYVYFVPYWQEPTNQHGEVLRLDTQGVFDTTTSWEAFDPGDNGVGNDPDGYIGGLYDGRYVWFVPCDNGTAPHSEMLRFDPTGSFSDTAAWETFDPSTLGITNGLEGHAGAAFDGRYIYFAPLHWTTQHGEVLRYDTNTCPGDFDDDGHIASVDYDAFVLCLADGGPVGPDCAPGDFDGDTDVDCDDWEQFVLAWTDPGAPVAPPQCPCPVYDAPLTEDPVVAKDRHLSFDGGQAGVQTAIRVTLLDLPAPFDEYNGTIMWVGAPVEYCENAGQDDPPVGGCGPAPGLPRITYLAARLQCDPFFTDWSLYGVVHAYHAAIVPGGTYRVQQVEQTCDRAAESNYSAPLDIDTSRWGDVVRDCTTIPCGPPDGSAGIVDVTALLDKFKNLPGALRKARADIEPALPDQLVNISDVTCGLDAFRGFGYPFTVEPPCL